MYERKMTAFCRSSMNEKAKGLLGYVKIHGDKRARW